MCYDTMVQFGMNGSGVEMLGGGAANRISRRRVARRMPWRCVDHRPSAARPSPVPRNPSLHPPFPRCRRSTNNIDTRTLRSATLGSTLPRQPPLRRVDAYTLASTNNIDTRTLRSATLGSTLPRWPHLHRVDAYTLAEITPPRKLCARRPPSRVRGCSRLRASSGSRHCSLGVLQLVICEHAASPHAPCAGRCSHFLFGECPLYTVAGHISSRSMAFCEPKPPPLVLHTTGATEVAVRCCSRCDLDAIPPPSCRGSD